MAKQKINKGSSGQNRKTSDDFLNKFKIKDYAVETSSGLIYRTLESGSGLTPTATDSVKVNQRILLANGKIITDTYRSGLPDEFSLAEAIPGLREGLQLMNEGARFEFAIPAELAWGKKGVGDKIGPNAVLLIDLRLLSVIFN